MFKLFKKKTASTTEWRRQWSSTGMVVIRGNEYEDGEQLHDPMVAGFLAQLADDGLALETGDGHHLEWDAFYTAVRDASYASLPNVLSIPSFTKARPVLQSNNSLADENFSIAIAGWIGSDGAPQTWELMGPLMTNEDYPSALMQPQHWELFKAIIGFARRPVSERTDIEHRQAWGRIRKLALHAGAQLDDFLYRSVVLTPERLEIGLRRSEVVNDDHVVEIEPGFEGAPSDWLDAFDRSKDVRDRYDIATPEGIIQVLVSSKVRTVLQEIKRLPGRRVAGSRAQAFLVNPYATLGDDAVNVIVESQFEKAREDAGLAYERFNPVYERDASGYPLKVGLLIETALSGGPATSTTEWLDDARLSAFIGVLNTALARDYQLIAWHGYDLAVEGDAERHLIELKEILALRTTPPILVKYAEVHDLSGYSSRVESIGVEKPYYSPYITKKDEGEGWFPENVLPVVVYLPAEGGEPVAIPTNKAAVEQLVKAIAQAHQSGLPTVKTSWLPQDLPLAEATTIVETFQEVFKDLENKSFNPPVDRPRPIVASQKQLVIRANIQALEYEELRRDALESVPSEPKLPKAIRSEYPLMPHQREGLAWMQHLFSLQTDYQVRGAVLADDMGLGKTFQLLALMAYLIEREPSIEPMLVVAPVSLLENWAEESRKFFHEGALPLLTAYGDALASLRVPKNQIDQRLQTDDNLIKFLRPNWVGGAKVVLTTYETLRDFEFSFAGQKWSLMVCDEAQRIKNPAAMVTRAAKKQNVAFKIACTGTPVENTLADMWCLFDFVQPGLLGALNDFGKRYRKPIEAKTEEEKARVEELRARIAPQILRRMKSDVAKELPKKIVVEECRKLMLSNTQRNLYAKAIDSFKKRDDPEHPTPFKNHLGLLHYLRLVCTDPRPHGLSIFQPEPTKQYREKAPKLDWLLAQLSLVEKKQEKAIIFCEFREIQRLLKHYIAAEFGFEPKIINGDTSASANHLDSRQKRIKAFQEMPGFGVLILSPVAVGFGVNIQAANHVVHYTRTWNPAKEDQATDRAYRIGQKKDVFVYYPVVCAEDFMTFDVKLDRLLTYKRGLAEDMLNGSGDVSPSDFSIAEVVPAADSLDIDERVTLNMALRMSWQHFECLVGVLWTKQGYDSYRTPGAADNGVDVVALAESKGVLVQAKTSGEQGAALNWDAVKEVVAGEAFYRRRHPNVEFEKVCITNQFFNKQAQENAALNSVQLFDQSHLAVLLERYSVTLLEVERMLYSNWHDSVLTDG